MGRFNLHKAIIEVYMQMASRISVVIQRLSNSRMESNFENPISDMHSSHSWDLGELFLNSK
jgi:hypothetical protein